MQKSLTRLFIATIIFAFVGMLGIVSYNAVSFYSNMKESRLLLGESHLKQETEKIRLYLNKALDMIQVTAASLEFQIEKNSDSAAIMEFLTDQSIRYKQLIDPHFTGIYGFINDALYHGAGIVAPSWYEVKERSWYKEAIENQGQPTLISPYIDARNGNYSFSVSQMLRDGKSVASLDFSLDEIHSLIRQINLEQNEFCFIIDSKGFVITHSNMAEIAKVYGVRDVSASNINLNAVRKGESFHIEDENGRYTFFVSQIFSDWYAVFAYENKYLLDDLKTLLYEDFIICLFIFFFIALVFLVLERWGARYG